MVASQYNTLSLDAPNPARKKNTGLYALTVLAVVAFVGVATFATVGQEHVAETTDSHFDLNSGHPVDCDATTGGDYFQGLPKYDKTYSVNKQADLSNSCYYAFRCCTTTGADCGEGNDMDMGLCRTCLEGSAPLSVNTECRLYLEKKIDLGSAEYACTAASTDPRCQTLLADTSVFTEADLQADRVPAPSNSEAFANMNTCWTQGGAPLNEAGSQVNQQVVTEFATVCFELFSWCNQMCPRNDATTEGHQYCKNCMETSNLLADL